VLPAGGAAPARSSPSCRRRRADSRAIQFVPTENLTNVASASDTNRIS
jgi:hypothetical protein